MHYQQHFHGTVGDAVLPTSELEDRLQGVTIAAEEKRRAGEAVRFTTKEATDLIGFANPGITGNLARDHAIEPAYREGKRIWFSEDQVIRMLRLRIESAQAREAGTTPKRPGKKKTEPRKTGAAKGKKNAQAAAELAPLLNELLEVARADTTLPLDQLREFLESVKPADLVLLRRLVAGAKLAGVMSTR